MNNTTVDDDGDEITKYLDEKKNLTVKNLIYYFFIIYILYIYIFLI